MSKSFTLPPLPPSSSWFSARTNWARKVWDLLFPFQLTTQAFRVYQMRIWAEKIFNLLLSIVIVVCPLIVVAKTRERDGNERRRRTTTKQRQTTTITTWSVIKFSLNKFPPLAEGATEWKFVRNEENFQAVHELKLRETTTRAFFIFRKNKNMQQSLIVLFLLILIH